MENYSGIISTNQTFTLQLEQVGKLADLALRTGMNKSEIVRLAIDEYYKRFEASQADK